jgi:hypothetical protein
MANDIIDINVYETTETVAITVNPNLTTVNINEVVGVIPQNLQEVTNVGSTTTNSITANSFVKSGGSSSEILAADGSVITQGNNITITGGVISSVGGTGGGGASVNYYLNGGTSQGTFGGTTYYEFSKTAVIGTGADFNRNTNGYIASFITDVADPSLLLIPAGNWNLEFFFSSSSNGGSPSFYAELYKYDGTTFTSIASGSAVPEGITNGTAIDAYFTALAVPETVLTVNDRLAIRVYVNTSGRTITLHTQNGHPCEVTTTFSTGLTALNGLQAQVQNLAVGTTGTDFAINSSGSTHTFNLPTASASNRGVLSSANWSTFNGKQNALGYTPANDASVVHLAGTETITGQKTFNPSVTAATAIAIGTHLTPTLVASANSDVLVGLDIAPTFTNGSFTGVSNYGLRVGGTITPSVNSTYNIGGGGSLRFANGFFSNTLYTQLLRGAQLTFGDELGGNYMKIFPSGNITIQNGGIFTDVASSRLTVNSTTQGFLPPRMTNAQRIAIATPAVGLCVYCTDAVEGLYINKSTGWTYIG